MNILDWISDNLFVIVIIAGVLGQLFKAIRGKRGEDDHADRAEPPKEFQFDDPELAERTRKIREDIQRKIAERQRGASPRGEPPPLSDEPAMPPVLSAEEPPPPDVREVVWERAPEPVRVSRLESQRAAEILEEQAAMADRLRDLEAMKAAAQRRAAFEALSVSPAAVARQEARGALLDDLHRPEALRRAFVLREVLGPPVGLR